MQNIGGKSQEYLNYSTDILKWKMFKIYKLFPVYSVPEKWSEYLKFSNTFLAQNRLHFLGCLFFWGTKISRALVRCMRMTCTMWHPQHTQRDTYVMPVTRTTWCLCCWYRIASHHVRCQHHIVHLTGITLWASHCVRHVRVSCQQGRWSGKISTLEILVPHKNKHPRKCNLFWARKVLEFFKYWSLLWHRICWE